MEFLVTLIAVGIIALLLIIINRSAQQERSLSSLNKKIGQLNAELHSLNALLRERDSAAEKSTNVPEKVAPNKTPSPVYTIPSMPPAVVASNDLIIDPPLPEPLLDLQTDNTSHSSKAKKKILPGSNKDMEKYIGENLANKIGIAVLVLGISFFVKYAIDKNWIRESGRVLVGLACGAILIGIAHYIRKNYRSFSSVLVGGGLTVFYFTVAFAFHQYQLIGQTGAFVSMIAITILGVLLALLYDGLELAILATIGAFVTPFLVSNGHENYVALFTYLAIVNGGLMSLAWFKRWPIINLIALAFTTVIYGGWLIRSIFFAEIAIRNTNALIFATIFYFQFIAMTIINNVRLRRPFMAVDFIVLLAVQFLYFAAGLSIFNRWGLEEFKGLFTASIGVLNLVLALVFYRRKDIDGNFVALLIGLCVTFFSISIPIQFRANATALFWMGEAIILFILYRRTRIDQLRLASIGVVVLMLGSLCIYWAANYLFANSIRTVAANPVFITSLCASVGLFIYATLVRREDNTAGRRSALRMFATTAAIVVGYFSGAFEISYQFSWRFSGFDVYSIHLQFYTFAFAAIVLKIFWPSSASIVVRHAFVIVCLCMYGLFLSESNRLSFAILDGYLATWHFFAHWGAAVVLGWLLYDNITIFMRGRELKSDVDTGRFLWGAAIAAIFVLSIECYFITMWLGYDGVAARPWLQNLYFRAGLSIVWAISSFVMMWLGMKYAVRVLRIISLTLFSLTLAKLFLYDIADMAPGGKIAAFILLGILLLTVSFMYQRLKKIIVADDAVKKTDHDNL